MSSEEITCQPEVVEQPDKPKKRFKIRKKKFKFISDTKNNDCEGSHIVFKKLTFKNLVSKIIALKKMYRKFKEHRINTLTKFKEKHKFRGQKNYAIEFMLKQPTKMVKQGDLLLYCDKRRYEDTDGKKPNFKDNSRGIESLRKDITPNCWKEKKVDGELYFIYLPELKEIITDEIIENTKHRNDGFTKEIIKSKMDSSNYKCELTGLPVSEGHLAGDHWIPKEGGGESNIDNCIILNKILNEKKNKHDPIVWFCKHLLTNFLNICKRTGMDLETVKAKLIGFIQEF